MSGAVVKMSMKASALSIAAVIAPNPQKTAEMPVYVRFPDEIGSFPIAREVPSDATVRYLQDTLCPGYIYLYDKPSYPHLYDKEKSYLSFSGDKPLEMSQPLSDAGIGAEATVTSSKPRLEKLNKTTVGFFVDGCSRGRPESRCIYCSVDPKHVNLQQFAESQQKNASDEEAGDELRHLVGELETKGHAENVDDDKFVDVSSRKKNCDYLIGLDRLKASESTAAFTLDFKKGRFYENFRYILPPSGTQSTQNTIATLHDWLLNDWERRHAHDERKFKLRDLWKESEREAEELCKKENKLAKKLFEEKKRAETLENGLPGSLRATAKAAQNKQTLEANAKRMKQTLEAKDNASVCSCPVQ